MEIGWHLQFFAGFRATHGSRAVERFRTSRVSVLLALLAVAPDHTRSREWLGEQLWPDLETKSQRANLRWLVHFARNALGREIIQNRGNSYLQLNPSTTSDLQELDRLLRSPVPKSASALDRERAISRLAAFKNQVLLPAAEGEELVLAWREHYLYAIQTALEKLCQAPSEPPPPAEVRERAFVGRQVELHEIHQWLQGSGRLLTLIGLGGIGKTRLAQEALAFHRATRVNLAEATSVARVWEALLTELHLPKQGEGSPRYRVMAHLEAQYLPPVFFLDNLEQLGDEVTHLLEELLECHPDLRILATSRRATLTPGEQLLRIPPLPRESGIQLFLARIPTAMAALTPEERNLLVPELCEQLQGIPLSIELAAARVGLLKVSEIIKQLKCQLNFLRTARPAWSERHRSQQAVLRWSYEQLTPATQYALRALSCFRSTFSLEMASWLVADPLLLDALEELQLHSLLLVDTSTDPTQFGFLVVVREFGQACLEENPAEREALTQRHTEYVLHQIKDLHHARPTVGWENAVAIVQREQANLTEVIRRASTEKDADTLIVLVENIAYLLSELGHWEELTQLLKAAQASFTAETPSRLRTYVLGLRAAYARRRNDRETAWQCWQEKLALHRANAEEDLITSTLMEMLSQAIDDSRGKAILDVCEELTPRLSTETPETLFSVMFRVHQVRFLEKQGHWEQALLLAQELLQMIPFDDWKYQVPNQYLAPVLRRLGEVETAESLVIQGLRHAIEKHFFFSLGVLTLEFAYLKQSQENALLAGEAFLVSYEINGRLESRLKDESELAYNEFIHDESVPKAVRDEILSKKTRFAMENSEKLVRSLLPA